MIFSLLCLADPPPPHGTAPECDSDDDTAACCPLLERRCYVGELLNSTTDVGMTSSLLQMEVTLRAASPRFLPRLFVHYPGLDKSKIKPKVVATDGDLVLLRVPVCHDIGNHEGPWSSDLFVYRPHPPRLDLLPNQYPWGVHTFHAIRSSQVGNPHPRIFDDSSTTLLRHADGYVVACLTSRLPEFDAKTCRVTSVDFDVHTFRSSHAADGWVTTTLPVRDPVRETLTPIPKSLIAETVFHDTAKAVAVGGARGTVVWADLWRGLIVCDLLDERPELRDVPLPAPASGHWDRFIDRRDSPEVFRDVAVGRRRDCIKYVETERWSDTGCWKKATVYSMPVRWVRGRTGAWTARSTPKTSPWTSTLTRCILSCWLR